MDLTPATPLTNMAESLSIENIGPLRQPTTTKTWPLRRSVRIIQQSAFRLQDLPPELRDIIYALAVQEEDELILVSGLTGTAKALSQVSRAVRADATKLFFSKNSFLVRVGFDLEHDNYKTDPLHVDKWVKTWGALAWRHIRCLKLVCGNSRKCKRWISVKTRDTVHPVRYYSRGCHLSGRIEETDLNAFALAVFDGHGEQKSKFDRLGKFLTTVEHVVAELMDEVVTTPVGGKLPRVKFEREFCYWMQIRSYPYNERERLRPFEHAFLCRGG